jgi:type IV secretory pathway VirB4 component
MTMVAETEDAIAEASSQLVAYGYYTPVIVMFDTDEARLRDQAEAVRRLIQAEGFGARIETLNATEAYLGSLPGNAQANVREPLINTRNLADLIPVNSVWAGSAVAPCPFYSPNAPPLMQVASGSSPFRLNLHVDDVGHTLIFGPTGSGKSTLLALIAAQFRRYEHAQIFAFDKGKSLYPLTKAAGGDHYEIGAGEGTALAFCPLAELSTDSDRAWAAEWVETLVRHAGRDDHSGSPQRNRPPDRSACRRARPLAFRFRQRRADARDQDRSAALHVDGPMGQLLDAEEDGLTLGSFQTFEVEELMNMGERNLVPCFSISSGASRSASRARRA